jgi:acetolactate synthase-1/2/3 large subunit
MELTCGEVLAKSLKKEDIKFVFGVPGGQLFPFIEAVSREEGMEVITTRHEENAAHMADAVSRLTGTIGVCFGTTGPGATNMLPGVAAAYADSIPLLAITPNNQTFCTYPFIGSLQDGDHKNLYSPITKWNAVVQDWIRIPELVHTAFRLALSGRPGPVHLDIPADIMFRKGTLEAFPGPESYRAYGRPHADQDLVEKAFKMLLGAQRPLLLAGGGVVRSEAWEEFFQLVKVTGIPATTTPMGAGCVPADFEGFFGASGWLGGNAVIKALQEADVVLAIGCRFSTWVGYGRPPIMGGAKQRIIHVDIDSERIGQNTDVALGIMADAKAFLQDMLEIHRAEKQVFKLDPKWPKELVKAFKAYMEQAFGIAKTPSEPMNQATVSKEVAEFMDEDAIVTFDGGQTMEWSGTFVRIRHPRQKLFTPGMGHLGFGQPFANAAKLCHPERQVINIAGDGGFGCTLQELETAVRYNLNVINVISDDRAWGMIKGGQMALYNNPVGIQQPGWR